MQKLIAVALLAAWGATARAGNEETVRGLIPTPKQCALEPGSLPIVTGGKPVLVILVPMKPEAKETMAAEWVAKEVAALSGVTPQIATRPAPGGSRRPQTELVLATYNRESENLKQVAGLLDESDRALLSDPKRSEQAYVLRCRDGRIAIVGGSAQGTLYGAMTLLQLFQGGQGSLSIPRVHVRDWPDFPCRAAENWTFAEGRDHWGRGWLYDWGDGVESYKRRVKGIFDRCLRYKINMICFSSGFGEPFSKMWNADAFPMQKELNRLADERGVRLMIGGYGIACNDERLANRKSYPDGEKYLCLTTQNMGNCRSNDELTRQIQNRFRDYVRKSEPRALYIHHEDADTYASAEWLWKHRCQQCRRRWPSDDMPAADGAAGAFTHSYNAICDAIFSVRNADSGYDAARDCLVFLVSPTYTSARESDALWEKQLAYWKVVGKLLKHKRNVDICLREQFMRSDNNRRRILEMSQTLGKDAGGPGIFLFFVSRASLYERGPLFVPVPAAMSKLNQGAHVAYYMCGKIFQEPMILMNAAHMWNTDSLGACPLPATAKECLDLYNRYARREADPPGTFGEGGFLELACRVLYGPKAGKPMERLYAMSTPPLCYARGLFAWPLRAGLYYDWGPELKATQEAITCVEAAIEEADCKPENRPLLDRFLKCLKAGEQFGRIRLAYQELVPLASEASTTTGQLEARAAIIQEQIHSLQRYLEENFRDQWATPRGGDTGCWQASVDTTRKEVTRNAKRWSEAIAARQAADQLEAAGHASLVLNGDMEDSSGWKFTRVTAEEDTGYADGGYVTDKVAHGKRAYRIVKVPVGKLSDKWPMPIRATWGEIEQEIAVQPGRTYVVAFSVFNNYGLSRGTGVCEHMVLVDDQERWSLDASAPKGWKSGGFLVTPKTSKIRLRLRTTDVRPCGGWRPLQGDSWWDHVRIYPLIAHATAH
jgi:hypothetical protein